VKSIPYRGWTRLRPAVSLILAFVLADSARAAFYINCASCHPAPQSGMSVANFQTVTNLGEGLLKVFRVIQGQSAAIELNVTNSYGGNYALNINNLAVGSVHNSNNQMVRTADPAWTSYFPGTATNFFLAGPSTTSPDLWTFNLAVKANTPPDYYKLKTQMAGYDAASKMWSQQESFYVQVVAVGPETSTLLLPVRSGSTFSVQAATTVGFTYYLEYKTDLTVNTWTPAIAVIHHIAGLPDCEGKKLKSSSE